ncbi:MAG: dihydropteroate synthase [Desulfobacterales bacterium]|nr:dihydropteroate synthase [Desulfobacterales bacterium]
MKWGRYSLALGRRTCIMGVVNVTPDSFSDGGKFLARDAAVAQAERLVREGADIIDIGGESTRPYADPVPLEVELERVIPVIETLAQRVEVPISIDTAKAAVARLALAAGAAMINDISALRHDPEMTGMVAESGVPVILMHMLGTPQTMQVTPVYRDVVAEIGAFLAQTANQAEKGGIAHDRIIIDPGIGFGKTVDHNLLLIKNLARLKEMDLPILIGPSRKAFIRNLLKENPAEEIRPDMTIVGTGTLAAVCAAALSGAHIVRVHEVASARAAVKIIDAILDV